MKKIIDIIQTKSGICSTFEAFDGSCLYATARCSNNLSWGGTFEIQSIKSLYVLKFVPIINSHIKLTDKERKHTQCQIFDFAENQIGAIARKYSGKSVFSRFYYFEMDISDINLCFYIVGLGNQGYKIPVYSNNKQIALIEKEIQVKDNLDCYQVYVLDDALVDAVVIFCMFIDSLMFANRGDIDKKGTSTTVLTTINKQLKSKYDEEFVVRNFEKAE